MLVRTRNPGRMGLNIRASPTFRVTAVRAIAIKLLLHSIELALRYKYTTFISLRTRLEKFIYTYAQLPRPYLTPHIHTITNLSNDPKPCFHNLLFNNHILNAKIPYLYWYIISSSHAVALGKNNSPLLSLVW